MATEEWPSELNGMLNSGAPDSDIVEFIEDSVPHDEAHVFDNKKEVYISSSDPDEHNKRRAKLAKTIGSLANVNHRSDFRFIFVGFDDSAQFVGIQYLGDNGGKHLYDADDQELQNVLRDHLEPSPSVEKHRLEENGDKGLVLVVEQATSPPVVLSKTVEVGGDRITTQGIAPTRRGSETTFMRHSDFRDIVEHREEVIKNVIGEIVSETAALDQSTDASSSKDSEDGDEESGTTSGESKTPSIGPTPGLDSLQKEIQDELITAAFNEFAADPFGLVLSHQAPHLLSEVSKRTGSDKNTVQRVWKFCRDDEYFRKRGNAWRITPKAIFRAEEIGEESALNDTLQEELLSTLHQEYRSDPHRPKITQGTLIQSVDEPENAVLQNLWMLREKGYIQRDAYVGGNAKYEITDRGRRYLE